MRGGRPVQSYFLPKDRDLFCATWWRIGDAAAAWDCNRTTAKRLIDRHFADVGRFVVEVRTMYGQSLRVVIPRDTPRPGTLRGNPHFFEPEYERELSLRRWQPDEQPGGIVARRSREARKRRAERRAARAAQAYHASLRQRLEQQRAQAELEQQLQAAQPQRGPGYYDRTGCWIPLDGRAR